MGSGAWAITNDNHVFGNSYTSHLRPSGLRVWPTRGFHYDLNVRTPSLSEPIDAVGGVLGEVDNPVFDANQLGQAVGSVSYPSRDVLLYSGGLMFSLGSFGGTYPKGMGINNQGMVVGIRTVVDAIQGGEYESGFVWTPNVPNGTTGTHIDLGIYTDSNNRKWSVVPTAISSNATPTVVGYLWRTNPSETKAFLWRQSTGIVILDSMQGNSSWKLQVANDVNSAGQIVGYGDRTFTNSQGAIVTHTRAFLLQPSTP